VNIIVPLRQGATVARKGVTVIGLEASGSGNAPAGKRRLVDTDFLKLTCKPGS